MSPSLTIIGFLDEDDVIGIFSWVTNDHLRAHFARLDPTIRQEIADALHSDLTTLAAGILDTFEELQERIPPEDQEEITLVKRMSIETENIGEIDWEPSELVLRVLNDFARHNNEAYGLAVQELARIVTETVGRHVEPLCAQQYTNHQCSLNLLGITFSEN